MARTLWMVIALFAVIALAACDGLRAADAESDVSVASKVDELLFGDYRPTGKLPITWPREMRQVPIHSGELGGEHAQFPYGYGLSY